MTYCGVELAGIFLSLQPRQRGSGERVRPERVELDEGYAPVTSTDDLTILFLFSSRGTPMGATRPTGCTRTAEMSTSSSGDTGLRSSASCLRTALVCSRCRRWTPTSSTTRSGRRCARQGMRGHPRRDGQNGLLDGTFNANLPMPPAVESSPQSNFGCPGLVGGVPERADAQNAWSRTRATRRLHRRSF